MKRAPLACPQACPCGGHDYTHCCAPWHAGAAAPSAEALMRSRYSAYALKLEAYLLATWHPDTRPAALDLTTDPCQWIALQVARHTQTDTQHATVEFTARYRLNGRAHRLHEVSRFICLDGRWLYLDGEVDAARV